MREYFMRSDTQKEMKPPGEPDLIQNDVLLGSPLRESSQRKREVKDGRINLLDYLNTNNEKEAQKQGAEADVVFKSKNPKRYI